jgi:DNA polymerase-3 subunit beta
LLDIHDGAIHLEAKDPNIGEIKDEIEIETLTNGAERVVKFNVRYLTEAIEAVSDEKVTMNIPSGMGGCVIRGARDKNYFAIVMPLRD